MGKSNKIQKAGEIEDSKRKEIASAAIQIPHPPSVPTRLPVYVVALDSPELIIIALLKTDIDAQT